MEPVVLAGSDTGALLALRLVATGSVAVNALVLAAVPDIDHAAIEGDEVELRASCPTHQSLLRAGTGAEPGALRPERIPPELREPIPPAAVPVLGLHGDNDFVAPWAKVAPLYATLPNVRVSLVDDGRHDVLNAANHRSVAATIVLFLEELRAGTRPVTSISGDELRRRSVLIEPEELRRKLETGAAPRILDIRWALGDPHGREHYLTGHIPGAVYVDLDTELAAEASAAEGRHPLPDITSLQESARRWGIRQGEPVVVYDDNGGTAAARAWWLLRWGGLTDVRILDGAWRSWTGEASTMDERPDPGDVTLSAGALPTLTVDEAAKLPTHGVLLDARAGERYRGETEPADPRAGHIPGAYSAPTGENLTADGAFRSTDELRTRFADLGVDGSTEIGVYCGSGVTAAHEIAALTVAGLSAALYPGSWSAWSADPRRPIETGDRAKGGTA